VVLFKPPDWEVHDENSELQLAGFMEAMFGPLKILKDEQHEHGFWAVLLLNHLNPLEQKETPKESSMISTNLGFNDDFSDGWWQFWPSMVAFLYTQSQKLVPRRAQQFFAPMFVRRV